MCTMLQPSQTKAIQLSGCWLLLLLCWFVIVAVVAFSSFHPCADQYTNSTAPTHTFAQWQAYHELTHILACLYDSNENSYTLHFPRSPAKCLRREIFFYPSHVMRASFKFCFQTQHTLYGQCNGYVQNNQNERIHIKWMKVSHNKPRKMSAQTFLWWWNSR